MKDVTGFKTNNKNQPIRKDVNANVKKILKFEYPKIFKTSKSLLFLIFERKIMLETKIINGDNFISILGI
tara:strand:- start:252 stop:461 length:210 start_codon:yes stop_codon:yes gene_type:complete